MLNKEHLAESGRALYGERWQTDLARDLGFSDARRIRQWFSDDRPIPEWIWTVVIDLLNKRKVEIDLTLLEISSKR